MTRVAVIGSGVAGLTAAYIAQQSADVTLFEADDRLGGHADTHLVDVDGRQVAIDTGFIVHNERTYPHLLRMFAELGVGTQDSDMSMSIRCDETGLEWAGALGRKGVFPDSRTVRDPRHLYMLTEIPRFHRMAKRLLERGGDDLEPLASFLDRGRFSPRFRTHFMEPLVAAVWSTEPAQSLEYPARYLFAFLQHHGMLQIFGSPQWRTVTGGSHEYVRKVADTLSEVRTGTKITGVLDTGVGVDVEDGNGDTVTFDHAVIATHPHQALAMLLQPTRPQHEVLSAITYTPNVAQLHTDESVMPRNRNAWASWNYLRRPAGHRDAVTVTYDLTRLMRIDEVRDRRFFVTLGGEDLVEQTKVIDTMEYEHPLYTPASVAAQARARELDSPRLSFAGAWQGWGFHEDGCRSGVEAAARLGFSW